jgi:hypothetical protein
LRKEFISGVSRAKKKVIAKLFPEEREFLTKVCEEIGRSSVNKELPVLYAGSGGDVEHAVLLGNNLVFVDSHLPEETISEIRYGIRKIDGKIIEEERKCRLGKGGKHVIKFRLGEEKITLTYYAEDAASEEFKPEEIERGCSVCFVKVPLPKEGKVGLLASPNSLGRLLGNIALEGFYLERECPISYYLNPEIFGFKKVASGPISALSINPAQGNLYKKFREVEEISLLLKIDHWLYRFYNKQEEFSKRKILECYVQLPDSLKHEVLNHKRKRD